MRINPRWTALALVVTLFVGGALATLPGAAAQPAPQRCGPVGVARFYWHYTCIEAEFQRIQSEHPDIATYYTIGDTVDGNPIFVIEFANFARRANQSDRPGFYLDATHHGNEIQGTEASMILAQKLAAEYGINETVTRWVDEFNIYINPVVNPDGNMKDQRQNTNSVDLNRNYPFDWGLRAGSYGPSAGSEPETQVNMKFMREKDLDAYVSLHTGSWDFVAPRCNRDNGTYRAPTADEELFEYTDIMLQSVSGMGPIRPASGTGESICWAYDVIDVYSILPEVATEQNQLFSVQETVELNGAMEAIYWLVDKTGRFGATLWPTLVANESSPSNLAISIHNSGMQTSTNWTLELNAVNATGRPLFLGNQDIGPGETFVVPIPNDFAGQDVWSKLAYAHLNVEPLVSDPANGTSSDPVVHWINFTQEEGERVIVDAGGPVEEPPAESPGPGFASLVAIAVTLSWLGARSRRRL